MNRIRAALALGLLLLPASALAQGEKKPAATPPDERHMCQAGIGSTGGCVAPRVCRRPTPLTIAGMTPVESLDGA